MWITSYVAADNLEGHFHSHLEKKNAGKKIVVVVVVVVVEEEEEEEEGRKGLRYTLPV